MKTPPTDDPRLAAGAKFIGRTGATSFQIRYSDDEQPVVWMAVAEYHLGPSGRPVAKNKPGRQAFEAAAAMNPVEAVMRLCDQLADGGECQHCHRPTGVTDEWRGDMPLADVVCWYRYDPETQAFRRGCEGDT
jgi:hypothetical protein